MFRPNPGSTLAKHTRLPPNDNSIEIYADDARALTAVNGDDAKMTAGGHADLAPLPPCLALSARPRGLFCRLPARGKLDPKGGDRDARV